MYYTCTLCGDFIQRGYRSDKASWLQEFRVVYYSQHGAAEPEISGVGLNFDPDDLYYTVPSNYLTRWDHEGYDFPEADQLPLMRQSPFNGRHGFILHANCYSILQEFFQPHKVPIARLLEVCRSFPFQWLGLSWGHDYGGMLKFVQTDDCLWGDQLVDILEQPQDVYNRPDPLNNTELQKLFQVSWNGQFAGKNYSLTKVNFTSVISSSSQFTSLPIEILERIIIFLPTSDVMNLSRTSKEMAMVIPFGLGQSFWASRFKIPFELSCIFEVKSCKGELKWMTLYFEIKKLLRSSPGLQNRKRIWDLIMTSLSDLVCMYWSDVVSTCPLHTDRESLKWKEVCGNLQPLERPAETGKWSIGCKRFYTQRISIPNSLRRLRVSTILIGRTTYVTGIGFISCEGFETSLGYITKNNEWQSNAEDQYVDISNIYGFVLAVGSRGIQAIQVLSYAGKVSHWLGRPENAPKTRRLATLHKICALETGFDGCKLVSLAVAEPSQPYFGGPTGEIWPLRDNALWFPDIPEHQLQLNDASFTGKKAPSPEYQPLSYVLFQGTGRIHPYSLTKVSTLARGDGITAVDFHCEDGSIKRLGCQLFGRVACTTTSFSIDNKSREMIESVEADLDYSRAGHEKGKNFYDYSKLRSFKIFTNQGHCKHFLSEWQSSEPLPLTKQLKIVPGSTVSGFYASWDSSEGLINLGVISEFVDKKTNAVG